MTLKSKLARALAEIKWTAEEDAAESFYYERDIGPILDSLSECVEAMQSSVARSDDYGDSHCSQPIRLALQRLAEKLGECE